MSEFIDKLLRPELVNLKPYESARRLFAMSECDSAQTDWLNANENPYMPEININPVLLNRYPDGQPDALIEAYANYAGVNREQVLATRGADESIELLIRTFCQSNAQDRIVICPPTYGMYAISAETNGTDVIEVPLNAELQLDLEALIPKLDNTKIVFVCSPNNPTGQIIKQPDLYQLLEAAQDKCLVVADEAYIEFCPEASVVDLLKRFANLVITRTLSKAFGLAGIRCGFTLANPDVINAMKKVIAPYPIAAPVAQIATQALSDAGINWMKDKVAELSKQRDAFLSDAKNWRSIARIYPSDTNFVLFELCPAVSAAKLVKSFKANDVLVRDQSKQRNLNNTIRVTIGD